LIETLIRSKTFQSYELAFNEATGMPLTLHSVVAWQLLFRGKRHENPFCAILAETSDICAGNLRFQEHLMQDAINGPVTNT